LNRVFRAAAQSLAVAGLALLTGGAEARGLRTVHGFHRSDVLSARPEILTLGITTGTTPTTFAPAGGLAPPDGGLLSRTVDSAPEAGAPRRPVLHPDGRPELAVTTIGTAPYLLRSDGADVWVANNFGAGGTVTRVRGSDESSETWTERRMLSAF
jgi:hypothetical protein